MSTRAAPASGAATGRTRAERHLLGAVLVGGWLLAAATAAVLHRALPMPTWLALHLLLLGGATNAVFVWGAHFARALLHTRETSERPEHVRLAVLNVGVVGVLVGVGADVVAVVVVGAALVAGAAVAHVAALVRMPRRAVPAQPAPLARTLRYYWAAGGFLLAGVVVGAVLSAHTVDEGRLEGGLVVAHLHLNLLGWLGLTILGTEVQLWPTVLRRKMEETALAVAGRVLLLTTGGLTVAVAGLVGGWRVVAVAGLTTYAAGVVLALDPFVRTALRRAPKDAASTLMAAGTGWLAVAVVTDVVAVAVHGTGERAEATFAYLVPMLAVGFVGQVLAGSLTFLLPVVLGGGPAGNRRLTTVLSVGWVPRLVLTNLGVALVALPVPAAVHTTGWVLALLGLATFAPLAVASVRAEAAGPPARRRLALAAAILPAVVVAIVAATH
jgi:nitrite reductase (NO-forming)